MQHMRIGISGRSVARSSGFSLIEVMVALIVLSVGLLGVARMQSLALSSTSVAMQRSMAAIEAESLASAMHANRGYWTNSDASGAVISIQGSTMTVTTGAPLLSGAGSPTCTSTTVFCTPPQLAAFELQQWGVDVNGVLPGNRSTINCGKVTPVSCMINITWAESAVAANSTQAAANSTAKITNSSYTLYVQP
jgi:type IV pilus assembly protein PilV